MDILDRYYENMEDMDEQAVKNYDVAMSYDKDGILVSTNWLCKQLGQKERQKETLSVLEANRISARDITVSTTYGVIDYWISYRSAMSIIANHDDYYVGADLMEKLITMYENFADEMEAVKNV